MTAIAARTTSSDATAAGHYRLRDAVRAEWTKFIALRSSRVTMLVFPVLAVVFGGVIAAATGAHWPHTTAAARARWDPTNNILAALVPGYLVIPVLGVLMMTNEYTHGMIRTTFAAVPHRKLVIAAKAIVIAAVAFVMCEAATFATFFVSRPLMGTAPHASLGQPGVLRALALSGAYLALMGVFGLAIGAIVRNSGVAVAVYAGLSLIAPMVLAAFPGGLARFGPIIILANSIDAVKPVDGMLSAWVGFAVMAVYAALALGIGTAFLERRDA